MSLANGSVSDGPNSRRILGIWGPPLVVLFAIWFWLAFSSGGYVPENWLLPSITLGLFALVLSLLGAYPRRPRQLSLAVLTFFALYSVWVGVSALWADSTTRVWLETGRTFVYLLVFALAVIFLTDARARRLFRYLVLAAAAALLIACIWKLWATSSIAGLFIEDRFSYPVSYPNNAAALFLVSFWPLLWLAAGPEERAPVRGAALGLATGLLGLGIMTQSRGAIWSLAFSMVLMFILSPARLRTLFYLLVPALLMVYAFPNLNRYWLDGPVAVGGAIGARTLLVASVTAAFVGMIVALLERWVRVSRRMKAIFGAVVGLAAVASLVYGSFALTRDAGGPVKWTQQVWREFTGQVSGRSESSSSTRFMVISSSGRVDIWRVAWEEFRRSPVLGIGADNFIFEYSRYRTLERMEAHQAHSFELQVLGETGAVGAVFAFGGILLLFGGVLWARCTAGWRGARQTWLRGRKGKGLSPPGGASAMWCNPRWGDDSMAYGWEIALLVGSAFWLIHGSVDWLWQMAGVSIPAVLFAAAAVASVDARVDVLWPRLRRAPEPPLAAENRAEVEGAVGDKTQEGTEVPPAEPSDGQTALGRVKRRKRARRVPSHDRLQPPGILSLVVRALLVGACLVVVIGGGLSYLSIQYQQSAMALARTDGLDAVKRAGSAHVLQPTDPAPYLTQASIYASAASAASASSAGDRAGAVLDNLALSIDRARQAIACVPADWSLRYRAGALALDLLLAERYAAGSIPQLDYATLIPTVPGLYDWSALTGQGGTPPAPGKAAGSLAVSPTNQAIASHYRNLSPGQLADLALGFFGSAKDRNPLATQVDAAVQIVQQVRTW